MLNECTNHPPTLPISCGHLHHCPQLPLPLPLSNQYPTTDYTQSQIQLQGPHSALPCPPETQPAHPWLVMVAWDQTVNKLAIWMPTECQMGDVQILEEFHFIFFNFELLSNLLSVFLVSLTIHYFLISSLLTLLM